MRTLLKSVLVLMVVVVVLAGCAPAAQPTAAGTGAEPTEVCKVGVINHFTGDGAPYGTPQKEGIEVAIDKLNASGGNFQGIFEDDRMVPADANTALLKLLDQDKVPVVMGSASSTVTLSYCKKTTERKVVHMGMSTNPEVRNCGEYFFGNMAPDSRQGPEWVTLGKWLGAKDVAVVYANNDYGIGVKDAFVKAWEADGGKVLLAQPQEIGSKDFRTEVLKLKGTGAKHIFLVSHLAEASVLLKQATEQGLEAQWIGDVAMTIPDLISVAGAATENMYGLSAGRTDTQEYKDFEAAFQKKFNKAPTLWSSFGYDEMLMVGAAVAKYGCNSEGILKGVREDWQRRLRGSLRTQQVG